MDRFLKFSKSIGHFRSGRHGFTLLEVMVALAVLSIALTGIYRLQGQTMLMSGSARFYSIAPQLAQAKLAETDRQSFGQIISGSGTFGEDFPSYRWTLAVEEIPSDLTDGEKYHLAKIDITVTYNDENDYQLRTNRFYVD
jgi:general secretion pathway protein I